MTPSVKTDDVEAGNTMILSIVLAAVAIALVLTFATITQMHIERKRLLALSDSAALHAASALDEESYYVSPGGEVILTTSSVREAAEDFLSRVPAAQRSRLHDLELAKETQALDSGTAQVSLGAFIRPGYIPWSITPFEGFRIEVTSTARTQ